MKQKIYIETSVVSYLTAKISKDIVVTWNFKHINNASTKHMIRTVIENVGYDCPEICSPDELLGG